MDNGTLQREAWVMPTDRNRSLRLIGLLLILLAALWIRWARSARKNPEKPLGSNSTLSATVNRQVEEFVALERTETEVESSLLAPALLAARCEDVWLSWWNAINRGGSVEEILGELSFAGIGEPGPVERWKGGI